MAFFGGCNSLRTACERAAGCKTRDVRESIREQNRACETGNKGLGTDADKCVYWGSLQKYNGHAFGLCAAKCA